MVQTAFYEQSASSEASASSAVVEPKFPKLTLPKFRRKITTWNTFWDSYDSAIHSNDGISDIDKFTTRRSRHTLCTRLQSDERQLQFCS